MCILNGVLWRFKAVKKLLLLFILFSLPILSMNGQEGLVPMDICITGVPISCLQTKAMDVLPLEDAIRMVKTESERNSPFLTGFFHETEKLITNPDSKSMHQLAEDFGCIIESLGRNIVFKGVNTYPLAKTFTEFKSNKEVVNRLFDYYRNHIGPQHNDTPALQMNSVCAIFLHTYSLSKNIRGLCVNRSDNLEDNEKLIDEENTFIELIARKLDSDNFEIEQKLSDEEIKSLSILALKSLDKAIKFLYWVWESHDPSTLKSTKILRFEKSLKDNEISCPPNL